MSTMDKLSKLANAVKSSRALLGKEALESADDLSKYYRKLGPNTLYHYDKPVLGGASEERIISRLSPKKDIDVRPQSMMDQIVSEPAGPYYANKLEDLPNLIASGGYRTSGAPGSFERAKSVVDILDRPNNERTLKAARLLPGNNHLDASSPQKWASIQDEFAESLAKKDPMMAEEWRQYSSIKTAEQRSLTPQALENYAFYRKEFTQWLRDQGYDSVTFPDVVAGQQDKVQTVLLNSGKAIGKYKVPGSKAWKYALISGSGLASAVGADKAMDVATGEGEAEAALVDLGKVYRASSEVAKKTLYRAKNQPWYWHDHTTKMLAGEVIEGKTVQSVVHSIKNPDTMRSVVFSDGTVADVERSRVRSWIMNVGTKQYADKFKNAPNEEAQYFQAYKSLLRHFDMSKGNSWNSARSRTALRTQMRKGYRDYLMNWENVEPGKARDLEMYSLVSFGGRDFTMPSMYVDIIKEHQLPTFEVIETPIDFSRIRRKWNPDMKWTGTF